MPKAKESTALTCAQLYTRLAESNTAGKYAIFAEVRNGGGFSATRSADAISYALWPSDGYRITGYEIKASRSDWLRELKNPKKSNDMIQHCDAWIILANVGVVDLAKDDIPEAWGVMEPVRDGLRLVRPWKALRDLAERGPVARGFLASLLRRAKESALTTEQAEKITADATANARRQFDSEITHVRSKLTATEQRIREFELASGVDINDWSGPATIGKVVRDVLANRYSDPEAKLRKLGTVAAEIGADIETRLAALTA